jgi:hypothetical protein
MSGYSIELKGVDELARKLQEAGRGGYIRGALEAAGVDLVSKARQYPPVPEGSAYQRTNKLRNSWDARVSNDGEVLSIGTHLGSVPYAGYVMGREDQTRVHAWHGWMTIEGIVQLNLERITAAIKKHLEKALR